MDRSAVYQGFDYTAPTDADQSSDSSSDDSDSDDELSSSGRGLPPAIINASETSAAALTLVDDDSTGLVLHHQPPEDYGEECEEDGEGAGEVTDSATTADTEPKDQRPETPKKKKKKRKRWYYISLNNCKYESVRRVSKRFGFKEVGDDEDWNLYWTDYSVTLERVMDMKKYQKINHFPGMSEICRKDLLARNMNRMWKLFPKEYNVFPRSWCLPADYGDFQAYTRAKKHKTYILKPESGCQGRGIWVTKNIKDIKPHEHQLCQQYISKPFLIDGFKFDLRIYTLVTSCDPLRIFVFKDGLARFATAKYIEPSSGNVSNVFMHLTNYAINKNSTDFIRDDEGGSKRRITTTNKWLKEHGYDLDKMWRDIDDVIIKTLISAHAILKHNYRTCFPNHIRGSACFEILGFDVMVDRRLKPYLVEVNHSPSFHTDSKLDKEIKEALLFDTMNLVNFGAIDKRKCIEEERRKIKDRLFQRQNKKETKEELDKLQNKWLEELAKYEESHLGNFRRIYPNEGWEKYEKYFHSSGSLYQETAAFKARSEAARLQREEILRKQEKMESMLKKKKDVLARPESPGVRRKRVIKRPSMTQRKLNPSCRPEPFSSLQQHQAMEARKDAYVVPIDTSKPLDITEEEELERISALLQRDNLVRGLGIVEHVYRLLHCTPGTMGIQLKNDHKYSHPVPNLPKHKRLPDLTGVAGGEKPSRRERRHHYSKVWCQSKSSIDKTKSVSKVTLMNSNDADDPEGDAAGDKVSPLKSKRERREDLSSSSATVHQSKRGHHQSDRGVHESKPPRDASRVKGRGHSGSQLGPLESSNVEMKVEAKFSHMDDPGGRTGGGSGGTAGGGSGGNGLGLHDHSRLVSSSSNNNNYSYNNNNGSIGGLGYSSSSSPQRAYHQGIVNNPPPPPREAPMWKVARNQPAQQLTQLIDKTIPHRTRYTTRKCTAKGGSTVSVSENSKVTPRSTGVTGGTIASPSLQPQAAVIAQYQYNFPNVVKVSAGPAMQHSPQGLAVISAPAPFNQRHELSSAESGASRTNAAAATTIPHQSSLENFGLHSTGASAAKPPVAQLRTLGSSGRGGATVPGHISYKDLEMRSGNHAVILS